MLKRAVADGWKRRIVDAAVWAPLILLLVVTLMTWRSERRQAAVQSGVLRDYAAIAAWQYARRANMALHEEVMHAFSRVTPGHMAEGAAVDFTAEDLLAGHASASAPMLRSALFAFRYTPTSGSLEVAPAAFRDTARALIARRLAALPRHRARDDDPHRMLFEASGTESLAIALWSVAPPDGPVAMIAGVVAPVTALHDTFRNVVSSADLLPGIRPARSLPIGDLALRLTHRNGGLVFQSPRAIGATASIDTTGMRASGLRVQVDIPPRLATALVSAGGSQLLPLIIMLVGAALLGIVASAQLRRARALDDVRSRFVANVSHELRTPLTQISMFAETLRLGRERSTEERRQFASIIHAESRRLAHMVEGILRFSHAGVRRAPLRIAATRMDDEVKHAVEAFTPIAAAANVIMQCALQPVEAPVDRDAMRQVVLNLLDNAVKHGGRNGTVQVQLLLRDSDALLMVDDDGEGIAPQWRERVFEAFTRADGHGSGAGIGLAVVKDIVTAHGGRVWIEQAPSGGARVCVILPGGTPRHALPEAVHV